MIPQKLTLQGFLSYLDETIVELSAIEMACVSGANGAGKSSLFDAMTWALFGKARRSDDALIHDDADTCRVELEFIYEDHDYLVQRFKARGKGTTVEFLIRADGGRWKPLTEAGLRATEERIRDVLHLDYDIFTNASFFLQGKADMFTQQNPSRRKEILSSILGLDIWDSYREEATLRRRYAEEEVKNRRIWLNEVNDELSQDTERRQRLQFLQSNLQKSEALRKAKEKELAEAQQKYHELQNLKEQSALVENQLTSMKNQLGNIERVIADREQESNTNQQLLAQADHIESAHQAWRFLQVEVERCNKLAAAYHQKDSQRAELAGKVQAQEARLLQERQGLHGQLLKLREVVEELPRLTATQDRLIFEIQTIEKQTDLLPVLEKELASLQDQRAALLADNVILKNRMNELKERIQALQSASGSPCPLCGQELNDSHRKEITDAYDNEGTRLGDQYRQNKQKISAIETDIRAHTQRITELRELLGSAGARQKELGNLSARLQEIQTLVEQWERVGQPRLQQVESLLEKKNYLPDVQEEIEKLLQTIQELAYDARAHQQVLEQEGRQRVIEGQYQQLLTARTAQAGLQRELETLHNNQTAIQTELQNQIRLFDELGALIQQKDQDAPNLEAEESELNNLRLEENRLRQECGAAQQMVDVLIAIKKRQTDLNSQIEQLNHEITRLRILESAFSKDGVPAMLIEQALPEIESQANLILDRLSGGHMSIHFRTERDYKDKRRDDKKQTLDILISDSAGSREYELFSGGEAFRINFAIRLALSRVLAGRAGARLQTLVIDEGFGSQDDEGLQRLIEAIHLVSPEFSKILIITHLDGLKDAFPSRIEVYKNERGSNVEVVA